MADLWRIRTLQNHLQRHEKAPGTPEWASRGESDPRQEIMESCEAGRPRIIRVEHRMHLQIVHDITSHG